MQAAKQSMKAGGDSRTATAQILEGGNGKVAIPKPAKIVGVESANPRFPTDVTEETESAIHTEIKSWILAVDQSRLPKNDEARTKWWKREAAITRQRMLRLMKDVEAGRRGLEA